MYLAKCQKEESKMNVWLNHKQSELMQELGPPDNTADDGQGGKILIYHKIFNMGNSQGQGRVYPDGRIEYTEGHENTATETRMYYANQNGIIYYCKFKGPFD
jgi:hypothetical protein